VYHITARKTYGWVIIKLNNKIKQMCVYGDDFNELFNWPLSSLKSRVKQMHDPPFNFKDESYERCFKNV